MSTISKEDQLSIFSLADLGEKLPAAVDPLSRESKLFDALKAHLVDGAAQRIDMEPMPTPRPRFRIFKNKYTQKDTVSTYHPAEYTKYKEALAAEIRRRIQKGVIDISEYEILVATFYFTYPESYPKKVKIENGLHRVKPDWDNLAKGLQDGAADACVIVGGDSRIASSIILKRYTLENSGYILFTLK